MSTATRTDAAPSRTASPAGYAIRDVARLCGLTPQQIRAYIRSDCIAPPRGENNEYRFSFQDLVLLRTARALGERLSSRKVIQAIRRLRDQLPRDRSLAGVRITAEGDSVVVHDDDVKWEPDSGQGVLDFDVSELAARIAPLAPGAPQPPEGLENDLAAEDWYRVGCDMEPFDVGEAKRAYTRAIEVDPLHGDAHLNLGRLLHEAGDVEGAAAHYRRVLEDRPDDPTAWYNLGVALEDLRRPIEARDAYEKVLEADPAYADAHFNLSNLCERLGDVQGALKHLQIYRRMQG